MIPFTYIGRESINFGEGLSTIEIIGHLQKTIESLASEIENIEQTENDYVDTQISMLNTQIRLQIDAVNANCDSLITSYYNSLSNNLDAETTARQNGDENLINRLSALQNDVTTLAVSVRDLAGTVATSTPYAINPRSGQLESVNNIVSMLYDYHRTLCLYSELENICGTKLYSEMAATLNGLTYNEINNNIKGVFE